MSAIEPIDPADDASHPEYPEFELDYLVDEEADPTTLTVFAGTGAEVLTSWMTVEESLAVPISEVR